MGGHRGWTGGEKGREGGTWLLPRGDKEIGRVREWPDQTILKSSSNSTTGWNNNQVAPCPVPPAVQAARTRLKCSSYSTAG